MEAGHRGVEGGGVIIEQQEEDICELCGDVAELRPYGPRGERVCYSCMKKDEPAAQAAFSKLLDEAEDVS